MEYNNVAFYVREIGKAIERGGWYIQLDKKWMKTEFPSLTAGITFFYEVFFQVAGDLDLKFEISTADHSSEKFIITWEKRNE